MCVCCLRAGFLVFSISVPPEQVSDAKKFVSTMSPNSVLTYELGGTLKYELPCSDVALSEVSSAPGTVAAEHGLARLDHSA